MAGAEVTTLDCKGLVCPLPVIKLSANPQTVATMSEHIDVDLTGLLRASPSATLRIAVQTAQPLRERQPRTRSPAPTAARRGRRARP